MVPRFGIPVPEYRNTYLQDLELYAHAVHDKEAALRNCWGFVDGTVRPIRRPNERIQRILYNGHKRNL